MLDENQVAVISGDTGCGKTTQLPQYLLEHAVLQGYGSCTRIVVTQPRRISAISVAERVATERGQRLGEDIGYQASISLLLLLPGQQCWFSSLAVIAYHDAFQLKMQILLLKSVVIIHHHNR